LVEQAHELLLAEVGGGEAVGGGDGVGGGGVGVVGVDVGEEGGHDGGHARADVLGGEAGEVDHGLVDGLDAVADGELVDDLLGGLVEVDLPRGRRSGSWPGRWTRCRSGWRTRRRSPGRARRSRPSRCRPFGQKWQEVNFDQGLFMTI